MRVGRLSGEVEAILIHTSLRIPPQLMGIVPQNAGGFGSLREAAEIWTLNELEPIQARLAQVNEWLGEEVVRFRPLELEQ